MSTEFIAFLPPPGRSIADYDRRRSHSEQPESVPAHFIDAMTVREEVFVQEQKVAFENEIDDDDARSFHWVVFASVSSTAPDKTQADGRKGSQGARKPVGCLRLVPPFQVHDAEGDVGQPSHSSASYTSSSHGSLELKKTSLYDGKEPYAKLGRLATLKAYRGLGLGKLLVNAAVEWAKDNPDAILPPMSPAGRERVGSENEAAWTGLLLVHSQTSAQRVWEKLGFELDEEIDHWVEEGIDHVAMWRRIEPRER